MHQNSKKNGCKKEEGKRTKKIILERSLAKVKEVIETRKKERAGGCTTNNNKVQQ